MHPTSQLWNLKVRLLRRLLVVALLGIFSSLVVTVPRKTEEASSSSPEAANKNQIVIQHCRVEATETRIKALEADFHANRTSLDMLLRAYAGRARASIEYFRSLTEYNKAVAEVHARKGTLLSYKNVLMAEGIWESTIDSADDHDPAEPEFEPQNNSGDFSGGWSESDLSFGKPDSKNSASRVSPDDFQTETPLLNKPNQ